MASSSIILIIKKKINTTIVSYYDYILFVLGIYFIFDSRTNKKVIVYAGTQLPGRISRIAKRVKKNSDYYTIVLCHNEGYNEKLTDPSFDNVFLYRNYWHALRIIKGINNLLFIHGYAPKSRDIYYFKRYSKVPVLLDVQDVLTSYFETTPKYKWQQDEIHYEKKCFSEVDGLIAHSLEPLSAYKRGNIKNRPKTLFFPIFCDDDNFITTPKKISDTEIHIVYVGGVASIKSDIAETGNVVFHNLIEKLSKQKIHLHIYPSPVIDKSIYKEYQEIADLNRYFHFHEPVAQSKLSLELSQYHFGVLPFFRNDNSRFSDDKFIYATSLKVFNYIEAGIPVLIAKDLTYLSWLIERYKCGISISYSDIEKLSELIHIDNNQEYTSDLIKGRQRLSLQNNINKLLNFYKRFQA